MIELFFHAVSEPWTHLHPYFWKSQPLRDSLFTQNRVIDLLPINLLSDEMFQQTLLYLYYFQFLFFATVPIVLFYSFNKLQI